MVATDTGTNGWRQRRASFVFIALTLVVLTGLHRRIFTYVSGQDPMTYVSLARRILGLGGEQAIPLADTLSVVAPGHPLLLALCLRLFGPFAPYWMPLPMAVAAAWLLRSLLRRIGVSAGATALILLGLLYFILASFPINLHFLLYPFRELPAFVALLAALNVFFASVQGDKDRPSLLFASSTLFLIAALIREPSILVAVGPLAYLLLRRTRPIRERLVSLGWFAGPLLLAVLGAILVGLVLKANLNAQFEKWTTFVLASNTHVLLDRLSVHGHRMIAYLAEQVSLPVAGLFLIGLWAMRRQGAFLCAFAVPSALLLLFYSFMEGHRRYLLSSTLFMAVFLGAGAHWVTCRVAARLPMRPRWVRSLPLFLAAGAFAVGSLVEARTLAPWGPRVLRKQIVRFQKALQPVITEKGRVFIHPDSRYVLDALISFTPARVAVVSPKMASIEMDGRWIYIAPDDETGAYRWGYFPYNGVTPDKILAFDFDCAPVRDAAGRPVNFVLGKSGYTIREILPKTARTFQEDIGFDATTNGVTIWFDFGNVPSGAAAVVHVDDVPFAIRNAAGIRGVHLPAGFSGSAMHRVFVSADGGPLPRSPVMAVAADGTPLSLDLTHARSLSVHALFTDPFAKPSADAKYAAVLTRGGVLNLPVPVGAGGSRLSVAFLLSPFKSSELTANLTFTCGTRKDCIPFSLKSGGWVSMDGIPGGSEASTARVEISVDPPLAGGNPLRMHCMRLAVEGMQPSGGRAP